MVSTEVLNEWHLSRCWVYCFFWPKLKWGHESEWYWIWIERFCLFRVILVNNYITQLVKTTKRFLVSRRRTDTNIRKTNCYYLCVEIGQHITHRITRFCRALRREKNSNLEIPSPDRSTNLLPLKTCAPGATN